MNSFRTWLYKLLLKNYRFRKNRIYDQLLRYAMNPPIPVKTSLHGSTVLIPSNYSYPLVTRNHPTFNNPYLELVYQTWVVKKRKLFVADIGAAVGDTFLFLKANIPQAIERVYCIEGSAYFLDYLQKNVNNDTLASIANHVLSDSETEIPSLIHHHGSSAMAAGKIKSKATTLDRLFERGQIDTADILKIDVDGYDGKVLKGALHILKKLKPAIIFEFHPGLIKKSENDFLLPFKTLADSGYTLLFWYDKFGNFSHESTTNDEKLFMEISEKSIKGFYGEDWHYDIVAPSDPGEYDLDSLKNCSFASTKASPW